MRTWAVLAGIIGMMMIPAVRRRTVGRLVAMPAVNRMVNRAVRKRVRNRAIRNVVRPALRALQ